MLSSSGPLFTKVMPRVHSETIYQNRSWHLRVWQNNFKDNWDDCKDTDLELILHTFHRHRYGDMAYKS